MFNEQNPSAHTGIGLAAGSTGPTYLPEYPPSEFGSAQVAESPLLPNMDLGEFMMDSDLDFLGRVFNLNRNVEVQGNG